MVKEVETGGERGGWTTKTFKVGRRVRNLEASPDPQSTGLDENKDGNKDANKDGQRWREKAKNLPKFWGEKVGAPSSSPCLLNKTQPSHSPPPIHSAPLAGPCQLPSKTAIFLISKKHACKKNTAEGLNIQKKSHNCSSSCVMYQTFGEICGQSKFFRKWWEFGRQNARDNQLRNIGEQTNPENHPRNGEGSSMKGQPKSRALDHIQ